ncbi:GNAT family N-acetyltransferase [Nonomuraea antimicrobica]|uniref:GNAT family N-acetyltransferase n=1 Tax=Nonomuraea antimicrobica TaxID=561173 RepID=A0ABP7CU53_9ACTN
MTEPVHALVRPATERDAAVLAELNRFVHALHVEARPDVFRTAASETGELAAIFASFLAGDDTLAYVAEVRGRPAGYVTAVVHRRPGDEMTRARSFVSVEHLAVDPGVARGGVGTALVEAVRTAGREAGCTAVLTDVWDFNQTALDFFEGLGFTPMRHWLEHPL